MRHRYAILCHQSAGSEQDIEEDKGIIRGKERREDHRGEEVYAICHQITGQFRPYVTIGGTIDIRLVS